MKKLFKVILVASLLFSVLNAKLVTFSVPTIDGNVIKVTERKNGLIFKNFEGKVVLLEFWGTHCPPCLYSINHYKKIVNDYKGKVEMVAVEVQMTPKEQLKEFVKQRGINYNVVTQEEARNFTSYIAQRARWRGAIPFLMILGKDGEVITMQKGMMPEKQLRKVIDYALKLKINKSKKNNSTKIKADSENKTTKTKVQDKNSTKSNSVSKKNISENNNSKENNISK